MKSHVTILVIVLKLLTATAIEIHRGGQFEADSIYGINCTGNMDIIVRNYDTKSLVGCKCQNKDAIYASYGNRMDCVDPDTFRRSLKVWDWDVSTKTSQWNRDLSKEFANHIFYDKQTRSIQIQSTKRFYLDGLILKVTLDCGDFNADTILVEFEGNQKYPLKYESIFLPHPTTRVMPSQTTTRYYSLSSDSTQATSSLTNTLQNFSTKFLPANGGKTRTTSASLITSTKSYFYSKENSLLQSKSNEQLVSVTFRTNLRSSESETSHSFQSFIAMPTVKVVSSAIFVSSKNNGLKKNLKENTVTILIIISGIMNAILIGIIVFLLTKKKIKIRKTDTESKVIPNEGYYDIIANYTAVTAKSENDYTSQSTGNKTFKDLTKDNNYCYASSSRQSIVATTLETTFAKDNDYYERADQNKNQVDKGEYTYAYGKNTLPKNNEDSKNNKVKTHDYSFIDNHIPQSID